MKNLMLILIVASNLALAPVSKAEPVSSPMGRPHSLRYYAKKIFQRAWRAKRNALIASGALCLASCATAPAPGKPGPRVSGYTDSSDISLSTGKFLKIRTFNATGARMISDDDGRTWNSSVSIPQATSIMSLFR